MTLLSADDWQALALTLRLASVTTLVLLLLGTPLAWWLARSRSVVTALVGAVVALPLVLPPTVLGFYLLLALAPQGPVGQFSQWLGGGSVVFSFSGLVLGSVLYSLPFMVQPQRDSFEALGEGPLEAAATLRASPLDAFFSIVVPLCTPGFLTASVLSFAHTVGEFGVVLMIGGNIPGQTRVASVQIYNQVEGLNYAGAHRLSLVLLVFSLLVLLLLQWWRPRPQRP
jgi:molybdate transport system permease protein